MDFIAPAIRPAFSSKVGLIDADFISYHVLSRCNEDYLNNKLMNDLIEDSIGMLRDLFASPNMLFCFTGLSNYRYKMAYEKQYKGNRNKTVDPNVVSYKESVVLHVMRRYPSLCFKELEADDLLSMLQDEDTFIYSEDKDLKQVPGTHWNLKKKEFYEISENQAMAFLMKQLIEGDIVDNIGGIKGCGSAGSDTLLTNVDFEEMPYVVINKYIDTYGTLKGMDTFVENWNLLKLRINRGAYFREKYSHAFKTLELLK